MDVQADLFGEPVVAGPAAPAGFRYWPDLLSEDEQARVVRALQALSFKPYEHLGYLGNRRIAAFGRRYDLALLRSLTGIATATDPRSARSMASRNEALASTRPKKV